MPCHACPFRMAGPPPPTGSIPFTVADVDAWIDPAELWACHIDGSPCQGALMLRDGYLPDVTREALIEFWVIRQGQHRPGKES